MSAKKQKKTLSPVQKRVTVICLALAVILAVGGVLAKYVWDSEDENVLVAKEFYFTSDLLAEKNASYVLNSSTTEITFCLGNNGDKIRFSQDDISYTVTLTSSQPGTAALSTSSGTLEGDMVSQDTITLTGMEKGKTYTVTATGSAGYQKTLTAVFTVSDKDENVYKHLDTSNDAYVVLTVWAGNISGDLTVEVLVPGLIPDSTDPILTSVYNYKDGTYGTMTLDGENAVADTVNFQTAYSSYTYRFFIAEGSGFDVDDFNVFVTKNTTEYPAIPGTP